MRQIRTIAANTFRLVFRRGTGLGVLSALAGIVVFIFFCARGDGTLTGELRLRLRYSLAFASVFLTLCSLFLACLSIRRDLDTKVMHVLTSYPLARWRLWAGKWCGMLAFALCGWLVMLLSATACGAFFRARWIMRAEQAHLEPDFWRQQREALPELPAFDELVVQEYERRRREATLPAGATLRDVRKELRAAVRREVQQVAPNGEKTWTFDLGSIDVDGRDVVLEYIFFAREQRRIVRGVWMLEAVEGPGSYRAEVTAFPYTAGQLRIPALALPADGRVRLTFKSEFSDYLVFNYQRSVKLLVDAGSLWTNVFVASACMVLHLGAVLALGMALATVLTLPVASFAGIVCYAVAVSTGFFSGVVAELASEELGFGGMLSVWVSRLGLWLSIGLRPPAVLGRVCDGRSVLSEALVRSWGIGFLQFSVCCVVFALWSFSRKEIDRVH
ncbi:MAG: ABC transporter permease [Lentisphaeria bacterium]|nr:ABC transporter permease [Lentisphaeria bacterium]